MFKDLKPLENKVNDLQHSKRFGRVTIVESASIQICGMSFHAHIGDQVVIHKRSGTTVSGEIIALNKNHVQAMLYNPIEGIAIDDIAELKKVSGVRPAKNWVGRIVNAFGDSLDGRPIFEGNTETPLRQSPPEAAKRKALGPRLNTPLNLFNTVLPIARGQRIGIFAGSGVGKSTLLAEMARGLECDIVVIALIGERGRELREFTETVLGPEGMKRAIVVAATSDQSPLVKRRAAWMATTIAESLRDQGKHVLLLMDSITRFAEAHREIALTAGEPPSLRAYPPSTAHLIANLTERAGTGPDGVGDITAVYSVLVAGSDMEEPIADITRGVLDGHIILDRGIAESGRFPAVDINKSVSRSLPEIASESENSILAKTRKIIGTHEKALPMVQTGLYTEGSDENIDQAIKIWPALETYCSEKSDGGCEVSFQKLAQIVDPDSPLLKSTAKIETN